MPTQAELMAEAYRRGLLPPEKRALYEEAQRRGLVGVKPKRSLVDDVRGGMANLLRGLAIGDELAAAGNVLGGIVTGRHRFGADKPGNVVGNNLNMLREAYETELAGLRASEDGFTAARPKTAALMRGTGMAATVAAPPIGRAANLLANATRAGNVARTVSIAGLTGAAFAAADRGTLQERAGAAARAARDPATLALSGVLGSALPAKPRAPRRVDPNVELLHREGVPITPGQQGGRITKAVEEAATSVPIGGDMIVGAQVRGQEGFQRAIANRALKPIGERLPDDIAVGNDAVRYAGDRLSAAYKKVLPEGRVQADPRFAAELRRLGPVAETMTEASQNRFQQIIASRVTSRLEADGKVLSGARFKQVESELEYEIGRFSKAPDPDDRAIAEGLKVVRDALQNAAARQNPKFAEAKNNIDRGWATLVQMETAAAKSPDGTFTPKAFAGAVASGDKRVRRRGYARGEALNQDIAQAGVNVLASKTPDSGTPRRLMQAGALLGGGALNLPATATTIAATSAAYSRPAQDLAQRLLSNRLTRREAAIALAELKALAQRDPAAGRYYQAVLERTGRGIGVGSEPPLPQR